MFAVVTALVGVLAAAPPAPEQVRKHVDSILADSDYQRELPLGKEGKPTPWTAPGNAEGKPFKGKHREKKQRRQRDYDAGGFGVFAQLLMYILMIAAGVGLVLWLTTELSGYWRDKSGEADGELTADADDDVVKRPLGDAEALAMQGKFGDAIHTLLLRTLVELSSRLDDPLPEAFTSREVLERVPIADEARRALSGLIVAVEVSHFGDEVPGEADYQRCLASFHEFAAAYTRGRA